MGKVEAIEQAVRSLSSDELAAFRRWFAEFDAAAWDRQIERDARSGKLDDLVEAERRFEELRDGVVEGVPAREVFARLRAKLSS